MTLKIIRSANTKPLGLAKRQFTIDTDQEKICAEGHTHKNVALKYLMRKRRSLLMTKDPNKIERLYCDLPHSLKIMGKQVTHSYAINWEKVGTTDFQGSRFVFALQEQTNF